MDPKDLLNGKLHIKVMICDKIRKNASTIKGVTEMKRGGGYKGPFPFVEIAEGWRAWFVATKTMMVNHWVLFDKNTGNLISKHEYFKYVHLGDMFMVNPGISL